MNRIALNSRVSTEGWRFDDSALDEKQRWSYLMFGENWRDSRLHGTVKARGGGDKWSMEWDIDKATRKISTEYLQKEPNSLPIQGELICACLICHN